MFLPTEEEAKRDDSPIQRPMCITVIADLGSGGQMCNLTYAIIIFLCFSEERRYVEPPEPVDRGKRFFSSIPLSPQFTSLPKWCQGRPYSIVAFVEILGVCKDSRRTSKCLIDKSQS